MRRERTRQTLKLQLLAFVLALTLIWYSLNPVPRPITRIKREDEPPDEKKRNVEPQIMTTNLLMAFRPWEEAVEVFTPPDEDMDDFEWPEFIDG
jgi:hypothetical protein